MAWINGYDKKASEAGQIVPDFTISMHEYGSSWNYLFFSFSMYSLAFLSRLGDANKLNEEARRKMNGKINSYMNCRAQKL